MSTAARPQHGDAGAAVPAKRSNPALIAGAWTVVGIPLVYGIVQTLDRAAQLFTG